MTEFRIFDRNCPLPLDRMTHDDRLLSAMAMAIGAALKAHGLDDQPLFVEFHRWLAAKGFSEDSQ